MEDKSVPSRRVLKRDCAIFKKVAQWHNAAARLPERQNCASTLSDLVCKKFYAESSWMLSTIFATDQLWRHI